MASRSLGALTVDLILKMSGFEEGMDKAERAADKAAKNLKALGREGERLEASLATPLEKAGAQLARFGELLKAGAISQATYAKASKQVVDAYNAQTDAGKKAAQQQADGAKLTASLQTNQQKYAASLKQADELLKVGAIDQQTYNAAIAQSKAAYQAASASHQAFNKVKAEGRALTVSLRTPQEQLTASVAKYGAMLKVGAINQQTYNRAVAQANASYKSATSAGSTFFGSLGKASGLLATFGVGFSVAAIIGGLKSAATAAVEFGAAVQNSAQQTGESAETMSELAYAAKQADVDLGTVTAGLIKMQKVIAEAGADNATAVDALGALGLTIRDLEGKKAAEQLEIIADAIAGIGDDAKRTDAELGVFGKSGAGLAPLFAKGAQGIRDARDAAHEFNAVLNDEQSKALADIDDAIEKLKSSFLGLAAQMTAARSTDIIDFIDSLTTSMNKLASSNTSAANKIALIGNYARNLLPAPIKTVTNLIYDWAKSFTAVETAADKAAKATADLIPPEITARKMTVALPQVTKPKKIAAKDSTPYLQDIAITVQKITTSATEQLYREMNEATQTATEKQIDAWIEFEAKVGELVKAGAIDAAEANKRLAEYSAAQFDKIEITADHIFPPKERKELSEFWKNAQQEMQSILADFLENPFDKGIEGFIQSCTDAFRKISAQAVAAQISEKLFSGLPEQLDKAEEGIKGLFSSGSFVDAAKEMWGKIAGIFTSPEDAQTPGIVGEGAGSVLKGAGAAGAAGTAAAEAAATATASATTAAAITAAGTAAATAITAAGTAAGAAFSAALATATAALTTAGTAVAGAITAAGTAAAAAIASAAGASSAAGGIGSAIASGMGGGAAGGGFTGWGGKFEPAGVFHRKEFVVRSESTMQPGAIPFLREFNLRGMALLRDLSLPGFASGGMVMAPAMSVPGSGVRAPGSTGRNMRPNIMQAITVNTTGGNISRQTELQITAAAARGVKNADRRNN